MGGGFFGVIGDRLGRSRTLMLTILTYALFTSLSYFAQTWWHLLIFRFVAALGIGGEWAVGASLLSETWPKRWRPWIAAVLQTAVNIGVLMASLSVFLLARLRLRRTVFLVGVLPALLVLWIRRAVPETEEWHAGTSAERSGIAPVHRPVSRLRAANHHFDVAGVRPVADRPLGVQLLVPAARSQSAGSAGLDRRANAVNSSARRWPSWIIASIFGNFIAAALANVMGYRRAIAVLCLGYFGSMLGAYRCSTRPQ